MKSILILLSPAFGHYHATYKLAAQLKERGYKIIYVGENNYKESVVAQGFNFYEFPFASLVRDRYIKIRYFQLSLISYFFLQLLKNNKKKMYEEYLDVKTKAEKILDEIRPSVILLDAHISLLYLVLFKTGISCFLICTTLSANKVALIPPLNSSVIPKNNLIFRYLTPLIWKRYLLYESINSIFQKIVYAGKDNDSFLKKYAKESGIRINEIIFRDKAFKVGLKNIPELVLAPKELDYPWHPNLSNVYHIGPSVLLERRELFDEGKFVECLDELQNKRKGFSSSKIVYCSLGTINYGQNRYCRIFFKKVINAFKNKPGWFVVISIGIDIPVLSLGDIPDNIYVFKVVPQLRMLSVCDVMITHGGLNTTKECILFGVPMLVYPLSNLWDQAGNAARVVYHKIGLRGKLDKDTSPTIFLKVNKVLQNIEFKKNAIRMGKLFHELNNSTTGVDIIDSFIKKL